MKNISLFLLMGVLMSGLVACQPNKNSNGVRARSGTVTTATGTNITYGVTNQCPQGMSNIGAIYDAGSSYTYGTFEDRIRSFMSATMAPNDIGSVSGYLQDQTGVRFTGTIKIDAAGNVVSAQSKLRIDIYDSIWLQNKVTNPSEQPIPVELDPAKGATITGQFNAATGTGRIYLKDQYGEIVFDGTYNAQTFSGNISFKNYTNVTGSSAAEGVLGQFLINSCGILQK